MLTFDVECNVFGDEKGGGGRGLQHLSARGHVMAGLSCNQLLLHVDNGTGLDRGIDSGGKRARSKVGIWGGKNGAGKEVGEERWPVQLGQ